MRRKDGSPHTIPDLVYIGNEEITQKYHLDELHGHAELIFSLFQATNGKPFNTREITERLEKHPEFKTNKKPSVKRGKVYMRPAMAIIMHYLSSFLQLEIIKYADPIEDEKSKARRTSKHNFLTMNSKGDPIGRYKHVRINGRFAPRGDQ